MESNTQEKNILIIGNGPSRELLYSRDLSFYDVKIGCNIPPEDIKVDYSCFVDARAARTLRWSESNHNLLGNFKLVFGPRCSHNLALAKHRPGSEMNMLEGFKLEGHLEKEMLLIETGMDQHYFSSGHLACLFAFEEYPNSHIHLFGFDSLFTNTTQTYSRYSIRKQQKPEKFERTFSENPSKTVQGWIWLWDKLIASEKNSSKSINIYTYALDKSLPELLQNKINVIYT